jgi:hypothetical protein
VAFRGPTRQISAAVQAGASPHPGRDALLAGLVAAARPDDDALAAAT